MDKKQKEVKKPPVDLTLFDCEPMHGQITVQACRSMQRDEEKHQVFCKTCKAPIAPKVRGRRKKPTSAKKEHPWKNDMVTLLPPTNTLFFDSPYTSAAKTKTARPEQEIINKQILAEASSPNPPVSGRAIAIRSRISKARQAESQRTEEACPRTKRRSTGRGCASMNSRYGCFSFACPPHVQQEAANWQTSDPAQPRYYSNRISIMVNFFDHQELLTKIKVLAKQELRTVPHQIILICLEGIKASESRKKNGR